MRFAIITDTHIRAPGGDLSSPFPVNERANARAEYAVGLIKAAKPEFTIHLGDVIHPLPHMPTAASAAAEAQRILAPLQPNLHFVPGNHDIGDKPSQLMPAGPADSQAIKAYENQLGPQYHTFTHNEIQIFCINSSLINSSTDAEQQQKQWLETQLKQSTAKIRLLFSHYPPFICSADEADHYDNYAEPGRNWLLTLAQQHGIHTIFSGHVHHFFYNRWRDIALYCLPATSFIRQDYAELFPVPPANEFGRDDNGKFGITIVEINNGSLKLNVVNTQGREGEYSGAPPEPAALSRTIVNLRHAWHLPRALPYNGPMEEFSRKQARNDYPLLRLQQLGIETIRLPGTDLLEPTSRIRFEDWLALGGHITPFCTTDTAVEVAAICKELPTATGTSSHVTALELLVSPQQDSDELCECTKRIRTVAGDKLPIWISRITSSADNPDPGKTFAHAVGSGAYINQLEQQASTAADTNSNGVVLQIPWEADIDTYLQQAMAVMESFQLTLIINLCLRKSNPAEANFDDAAIAKRIATANKLIANKNNLQLLLDNFEDVDRGYGPRHGLIDRLSNIRSAHLPPS